MVYGGTIYGATAYSGIVDYGKQIILQLDTGSYDLAGYPAVLSNLRGISASSGSFLLSGQSSQIILHRRLLIERGIYTLAGMNANLLYRVILAGQGRTYYVLREDRTIKILPDPDIKG